MTVFQQAHARLRLRFQGKWVALHRKQTKPVEAAGSPFWVFFSEARAELMRWFLHGARRHQVAAIAFGVGAFVLAACEGTGTGSGTIPSSLSLLANLAAATKPNPVFTFVSYSVTGPDNTVITGIDNNKGGGNNPTIVVGDDYNQATGFPVYKSFEAALISTASGITIGSPTTEPPSPWPTKGIYLTADTAISNPSNTYQYAVGFAKKFTPSPCNAGPVCGVIYEPNGNNLSQIADPKAGSSTCSAMYLSGTYLRGTNGSKIQVGYYTDSSCTAHAIEEYTYPGVTTTSRSTTHFVEFHFPWYVHDSKAFGISDYGDVVGTFTIVQGGAETGWLYQDLHYTTLPQLGYSTQALGVSTNDYVVGSYQTCATCTSHGFMWGHGISDAPLDYSVSNPTVINDITGDAKTIVGWYAHGSHGFYNGFVGTCEKPNCPGDGAKRYSRRDYATSAGGVTSATRPQP